MLFDEPPPTRSTSLSPPLSYFEPPSPTLSRFNDVFHHKKAPHDEQSHRIDTWWDRSWKNMKQITAFKSPKRSERNLSKSSSKSDELGGSHAVQYLFDIINCYRDESSGFTKSYR
jgi:hypothetical protein